MPAGGGRLCAAAPRGLCASAHGPRRSGMPWWAMTKRMTCIAAALTGCLAIAAPAAAGLFSATGAVIAIVAGELFLGEAEGHLDGGGTLSIRSQKDPGVTCHGTFISSVELGGSGALRCSDGASGTFRFQRLSLRRGHGTGSFSRGSMSFAYGLDADEAAPYLALPLGKKLGWVGAELRLLDP